MRNTVKLTVECVVVLYVQLITRQDTGAFVPNHASCYAFGIIKTIYMLFKYVNGMKKTSCDLKAYDSVLWG